jgi:membrane-associated phospholipid phosphatase
MPRSALILLAASFLLASLFIVWAFLALGDTSLTEFDQTFAIRMKGASSGHELRRDAMIFVTHMGGIPAMAFLALVGVLWQWRRGDPKLAIAWALIVAGGGLLNLGLKVALDRPRPGDDLRDQAVRERNESFPSGHSMGAAIGYGMLAYAAARAAARRRTQVLVYAGAALWVAVIGFSRIYLRAHWFSDVLGGFMSGLAWLTLGLALLEWRCSRPGASTVTTVG